MTVELGGWPERPEVVPGFIARHATPIVVVCDPRTPDRTAAMFGRGPTPLPYLQSSIATLERLGATHVGVPCNTAHHFLFESARSGWRPPGPIVDMVEEAARAAAATGADVVGVLATTGTVRAGLYQTALARLGLRAAVPTSGRCSWGTVPALCDRMPELRACPRGAGVPAELLDRIVEGQIADLGELDGLLMEAIYGEAGVKAGVTDGLPRQLVERAAEALVRRDGAGALILGCTELPLVLTGTSLVVDGRRIALIDSTAELARRLCERKGTAGIAGGLGPEATIDLLRKMRCPDDLTGLLDAVFRTTLTVLGATRDQDHLFLLAAADPDPAGCARRMAAAGATLLVPAGSASEAFAGPAAGGGLPLLSGPAAAVADHIVRAAGFSLGSRPVRS